MTSIVKNQLDEVQNSDIERQEQKMVSSEVKTNNDPEILEFIESTASSPSVICKIRD